ncbi:MAG: M23 family metallopeptidase [Candidatus Taylorbacteria bacterium]
MKKILLACLCLVAVVSSVLLYKINFTEKIVSETRLVATVSPTAYETQKAKPVTHISIRPEKIYPGDPVFITIDSPETVKELFFDKQKISVFEYEGKPRGLSAINFSETNLLHEVKVIFTDGQIATTSVAIAPRAKIERPVGIPEKLGGNTKEAGKALVTNLAIENAVLADIETTEAILWKNAFQFPLDDVFVTDPYGYNRDTVGQTIVHKGTDFRAVEGTKVMAMNAGVVRLARQFTVYGNTIVIDHGLGVATLYMHLSKINVKNGDTVTRGQVIGASGETGYAEAPHLHISVKIKGISIDPMTFLGFFSNQSE